jgi:hypothetical protein
MLTASRSPRTVLVDFLGASAQFAVFAARCILRGRILRESLVEVLPNFFPFVYHRNHLLNLRLTMKTEAVTVFSLG